MTDSLNLRTFSAGLDYLKEKCIFPLCCMCASCPHYVLWVLSLLLDPVLQVGWYNSVLPTCLHLSYPEDTLAVVVLSTPAMFERAFLPFLEQKSCEKLSDPIDQCVRHHITSGISQVRARWDWVVENDTRILVRNVNRAERRWIYLCI